jgi:U3 small nucleolar RNA-associated protein 22
VQSLFLHPTNDYDVVLDLNQDALPRFTQNVSYDENLIPAASRDSPFVASRVDFDPVQLLCEDLKVSFQLPCPNQ